MPWADVATTKEAFAGITRKKQTGGINMLDILAVAIFIMAIIWVSRTKSDKPDKIPGWEGRSREAKGISKAGENSQPAHHCNE